MDIPLALKLVAPRIRKKRDLAALSMVSKGARDFLTCELNSRGVTLEGKQCVLAGTEHSNKEWAGSISTLELSYGCGYRGPPWTPKGMGMLRQVTIIHPPAHALPSWKEVAACCPRLSTISFHSCDGCPEKRDLHRSHADSLLHLRQQLVQVEIFGGEGNTHAQKTAEGQTIALEMPLLERLTEYEGLPMLATDPRYALVAPKLTGLQIGARSAIASISCPPALQDLTLVASRDRALEDTWEHVRGIERVEEFQYSFNRCADVIDGATFGRLLALAFEAAPRSVNNLKVDFGHLPPEAFQVNDSAWLDHVADSLRSHRIDDSLVIRLPLCVPGIARLLEDETLPLNDHGSHKIMDVRFKIMDWPEDAETTADDDRLFDLLDDTEECDLIEGFHAAHSHFHRA